MLNMFPELVLFLAGGLLLFFGAEYLIESSKSIAEKFSIPKIVVSITLVAFGTSLPELIVSIMATLRGESGIVVGNVIGSNIANLGLVLGYEKIKLGKDSSEEKNIKSNMKQFHDDHWCG